MTASFLPQPDRQAIAGDARLARLFNAAIAEVEAVSFDVLDTLYYRLVPAPEDVFDLVGARRRLFGFRTLREQAQSKAFQVMRETGRAEIDLDSIYACLRPLPIPAATLQADEEALELAVLRLNPEVAALFAAARAQGKRVVLMSDMYLSRTFFENLCARDALEPEAIFVSSDRQATKRDHGALFIDVAQSLRLDPSAILHIGDNPQSDVARALEQGFRAFHYQPHHAHGFSRAESVDERLVQGVALAQTYPQDWSEWRRLGFAYGGPATLALTRFVDVRAQADKVDLVLNVARDGYTLHRLWPAEAAVPSVYFKTSRTALTLSAMTSDSFESDLPFLLSGADDLTLADVFARIGVERPADLLLHDLGLDAETLCTPATRPVFQTLLRLWKYRILRVCNETRRGLHAYLHASGLKDGMRVGFVDVGWSGTTQDAFLRATAPFMDLDVRGYYLCLREGSDTSARRKRLNMAALIEAPARSPADVEALWRNRVAVELFFSAPHASIIGYVLDQDGHIAFVEDPGRGADPRLAQVAYEIDRGIGDAVALLRQLEADVGLSLSAGALLAPLVNLALHPGQAQVKLMGDLCNFDAWGSSAGFQSFMARRGLDSLAQRADAWPSGVSALYAVPEGS